MDRGLLECFGPQGLATEIYRRSRDLTAIPLGFVFRSLFILLGSLTVILFAAGAGGWLNFSINFELPLLFSLLYFFFTGVQTLAPVEE